MKEELTYYGCDTNYEEEFQALENMNAIAEFIVSNEKDKIICDEDGCICVTTKGSFLLDIDEEGINKTELTRAVLQAQGF